MAIRRVWAARKQGELLMQSVNWYATMLKCSVCATSVVPATQPFMMCFPAFLACSQILSKMSRVLGVTLKKNPGKK